MKRCVLIFFLIKKIFETSVPQESASHLFFKYLKIQHFLTSKKQNSFAGNGVFLGRRNRPLPKDTEKREYIEKVERAQGFQKGKFPTCYGLFLVFGKKIPFNAKRSLERREKPLLRYLHRLRSEVVAGEGRCHDDQQAGQDGAG